MNAVTIEALNDRVSTCLAAVGCAWFLLYRVYGRDVVPTPDASSLRLTQGRLYLLSMTQLPLLARLHAEGGLGCSSALTYEGDSPCYNKSQAHPSQQLDKIVTTIRKPRDRPVPLPSNW